MNLAGCHALATIPENKVWYRAIQPQHWQTALQTVHTARIPSRYSPASNTNPAFPILYLAENHQVALFEVEALFGSPLPGRQYLPNPGQAWIILNVQVTLQAVADLTLVSEQQKIFTNVQELTGDWDCYRVRASHASVNQPVGLAPTQLLGQALHGIPGLEGFRTVSARIPTHMDLVVFPDKLRPNSSVVFTNEATGRRFTIP
jgi:hypothetical protein